MNYSEERGSVFMGRKIERIRRLKGIKQDDFAGQLGISRQSLSKLEQSEFIEEEKLKQIALALGISTEAIREFNDETPVQTFNTFNEQCTGFNFSCTFNPVEKIVELYEALLKSEREKIEMLQSIIDSKSTSRQ